MTLHVRPIGEVISDVGDVLVSRPRPHILVLWEPVLTKAPGPHLATPFCCYIRTIVFYEARYSVRPWSRICRIGNRWHASRPGDFERWDEVQTRLYWDAVVGWQGERFQLTGGRVVWAKGRWWVRRGARRVHADRAAA